jgi:DnaJ-class molecular chaperone
MDIKTKFDIGQTVYAVNKRHRIVKNRCDICNGKGRYIINEQYSTVCPKCSGEGFFEENYGMMYDIFTKSSVGKIIVEEHYKKGRKEKYMLKGTGIDSGALWTAEELFASKEEAKKYCEKMNK